MQGGMGSGMGGGRLDRGDLYAQDRPRTARRRAVCDAEDAMSDRTAPRDKGRTTLKGDLARGLVRGDVVAEIDNNLSVASALVDLFVDVDTMDDFVRAIEIARLRSMLSVEIHHLWQDPRESDADSSVDGEENATGTDDEPLFFKALHRNLGIHPDDPRGAALGDRVWDALTDVEEHLFTIFRPLFEEGREFSLAELEGMLNHATEIGLINRHGLSEARSEDLEGNSLVLRALHGGQYDDRLDSPPPYMYFAEKVGQLLRAACYESPEFLARLAEEATARSRADEVVLREEGREGNRHRVRVCFPKNPGRQGLIAVRILECGEDGVYRLRPRTDNANSEAHLQKLTKDHQGLRTWALFRPPVWLIEASRGLYPDRNPHTVRSHDSMDDYWYLS
jgi:hypothetical protein